MSQKSTNIKKLELDFDDLDHSRDEIFTILGYSDGESPEHLQDMLDEVIAEAAPLCEIRGGYKQFTDIKKLDDRTRLQVDDVELNTGKTIYNQLQSAKALAVLVCTIGSRLESWSKKLINEGDFFKGYLADAVASQTVELAANKIMQHLEEEQCSRGLSVSNLFSPGYCDWHVSEQQKLFSLLPKDFCFISLTASSLMVPIKSVSGIIGIGPNVRKLDSTCRLCAKTDCVYRRRLEKTTQDA